MTTGWDGYAPELNRIPEWEKETLCPECEMENPTYIYKLDGKVMGCDSCIEREEAQHDPV